MQRPTGVIGIAAICFLIAGYIGTAGVVMFVWRKSMSAMPGAAQLPGLRLGGPHVALLVGVVWALIGWGLLRLHNWARWAAMLVAVWGIASGLANVVAFSAHFGWSLLSYGVQIIVRVAAVWYLLRAPVAGQFSKPVKTT